MRTTLTLDDDLGAKLKELARRRRLSFKDLVNSLLRRALSARESTSRELTPFRAAVFRSRFQPGVDPLRLNQLADEIEVRGVDRRP